MIENSQHGFTKLKSCLTNSNCWSMRYYNEITASVDKGRTVSAVWFRAISFSGNFLKVLSYGLNKRMVRWVETWLYCMALRVVINSTKSNCWCLPESFLRIRGPLLIAIYQVQQVCRWYQIGQKQLTGRIALRRGIWAGWKNGLIGASWNSAKAVVKSCCWDRITSCTTTGSYAGVRQLFKLVFFFLSY